jgi:hypothetical protein
LGVLSGNYLVRLIRNLVFPEEPGFPGLELADPQIAWAPAAAGNCGPNAQSTSFMIQAPEGLRNKALPDKYLKKVVQVFNCGSFLL